MVRTAPFPLAQLSALEGSVDRLAEELPQLIRASHVVEVRQQLNRCLWQTRVHLRRLGQAFLAVNGGRVRSRNSMFAALLRETTGILNRESSSPLREATILFACQRTMRYELVLYREVLAVRCELPGGVLAKLRLSLNERELSELQLSELLNESVMQMRGQTVNSGVEFGAPTRARAIRRSPAALVIVSELSSALGGSVV